MCPLGLLRFVLPGIVLVGCAAPPSSHSDTAAPGAVAGSGTVPSEEAGVGGGGGPADSGASRFVYGPPNAASGLPGLLSSVQIVTVTWTRDSEDITAEIAAAFATPALGSSAWWAGLSRYCAPGTTTCVGGMVSVTSAQIGDAPAYPITDSAIVQSTHNDSFARFIRDKSQLSLHVLPAPTTASTLYVVFMPLALAADFKGPGLQEGYGVTVDGVDSCGYHSAAASGTGTNVAYVVVPRCKVAGQSNAEVAIATAFRQIADAVTDPFRALGQVGFQNPLAPAEGLEIGDVCSGTTGMENDISGFSVPQLWSDTSLSCVP